MKYKILAICPNGCVIPVRENNGVLEGTEYIEPGDYKWVKEHFSYADQETVKSIWTVEVIAARGAEVAAARAAEVADEKELLNDGKTI